MKTTRRDLFKFAGGGAAGLLLTPAPWRLVTDTALWSENWPGIPRPVRGEWRTRFTHCALCPAGCAVKARCAGSQPVSLLGLPGRPLCAFGLSGHHLPYHAHRVTRGDTETVRALVSERAAHEPVAMLDLRPGRTASWTYRRALAALPHGIYIAPQSALTAVNLDAVKTILSLGVPVLDGWGTPAKILEARRHFRLIQAEPAASHTALLADEWLAIQPGTEDALAQALTGESSGERTGLAGEQIAALARELSAGGVLVLAREETEAVIELNRKLGAFGRTIVSRREAPIPASWRPAAPATPVDSIPDHSIGVLLIDESAADCYVPWTKLEPKLARDPLVVTFASSRAGYSHHSHVTLPAHVYPEIPGDLPPAIDSVEATFRLTTPLVAAPREAVDPAEFLAGVAGLKVADALRERADAIHASGHGFLETYTDSGRVPVKNIKAEDFWKGLSEGGAWTGAAGGAAPPPDARPSTPAVVAMTWEMRAARGPMPPLVSKLYRESNLRARI